MFVVTTDIYPYYKSFSLQYKKSKYFQKYYNFLPSYIKAIYTNSTFSVMNNMFRQNFSFYTLDTFSTLFYDIYIRTYRTFTYVLTSHSPAVFHRFLQAFLAHRQHYSILYFICWQYWKDCKYHTHDFTFPYCRKERFYELHETHL